jgi:hypothetical protein
MKLTSPMQLLAPPQKLVTYVQVELLQVLLMKQLLKLVVKVLTNGVTMQAQTHNVNDYNLTKLLKTVPETLNSSPEMKNY